MLRLAGGDRAALDALLPRVYAELKRLAHATRARRPEGTLSTTALVHEAYLKLVPSSDTSWRDRAHFFGVAARAMRQVLVDAARRQARLKRGNGAALVTFEDDAHAVPVEAAEVLELDDALERLARLSPRQARVVEHRFFAGLTAEESAMALGISVPTADRDWRAARAWLAREMRGA